MSIHRRAAKRDANEPVIMKRFRTHGWHVEQLSGTGMPDLLCWPRQAATPCHKVERCLSLSVLVDVKMPDGKPTKAQVSKWTYLRLQGIPVYVVRTVEDVDAIVGGTAAPWSPMEAKQKKGKARKSYTPPRSTPPDAAKEAEAFAPPRQSGVSTGRPVSIVLSCRGINTEVTGMSDEEVATKVAQLVNAPPPPRTLGEHMHQKMLKPPEPPLASRHEMTARPTRNSACLDPDKMNGVGDQFPGSDYD